MRRYIILGPVAMFLLFCVLTLLLNLDFVDELEYRLSRYHTFGEITVMVDGREINMDGMPVHFINAGVEETAVIDRKRFRLRTGEKGVNEYRISLPLSVREIDIEYLDVHIVHINYNWWHVLDLTINIDISTEPTVIASMSGSIDTRTRSGPSERGFEILYKAITKDDNLLHVTTQGP